MVEIKIGEKIVKFKSFSNNSHLKTNNLVPLDKLEIDTSSKITRWYFNGEYKSGTHYLQAICPACNTNLFSITTTRLIKEIKTESGEVSFICRSCSCKKNVKKVDMEKRAKIRREKWNKKTEEEKEEWAEAISKSRLKNLNITDTKIKHAIHAYTVENQSLVDVSKILGIENKQSTARFLENYGISIRSSRKQRSIYMQKNPNLNPAKRPEVREKISKWLKENPSNRGKKSNIEQEFYTNLVGDKEQHPYLENKQYDASLDGVYIEFDGVYWHGKTGNSFDLNQMFNMLNDEQKNQLIIDNNASLYRVWSDFDLEDFNLKELRNAAYFIIENGIIKRDMREYSNLIVTAEYMKEIAEKYPDDIEENLYRIALFVQTFYPFPYMESDETLDEIVDKIRGNKIDNLTSSLRVGNDFLKSKFKSYYHASKGKKNSMYDAYYNLDELVKIIGNRLGITYKESWDLTPEVIRRGFISNYYSISFFNPVLAYKILNKIANPSDTILDMSAGFGGRLLGWYAYQNNGKYIGYEPNKKTYSELKKFSKELKSNIKIYNKPFEDCIDHNIDICFSCPPYYDTEIYDNDKTQSIYKHNTFNEWIKWLKHCINKMKNMSNKVYLVVNEKIKNELDCETIDIIKNKGSHFTKNDNYEYLIKCN